MVFKRAVECDAVFVHQRGVAQAAHPVGAVGASGKRRHGGDDAVEFRLAARMGVGIAFDQPARVDDFDGEIVVPQRRAQQQAPSHFSRCAISRLWRSVVRRIGLSADENIEHQKPVHRSRAHAAALAERPAEQGRTSLNETAERRRHGAGHFLQPRMHVFRGVDDLPVAHALSRSTRSKRLRRVFRSATRITSS